MQVIGVYASDWNRRLTKPAYILGISAYYHDSAAALLRDGEIIAAASEERFTRIKGDAAFPARGGALRSWLRQPAGTVRGLLFVTGSSQGNGRWGQTTRIRRKAAQPCVLISRGVCGTTKWVAPT